MKKRNRNVWSAALGFIPLAGIMTVLLATYFPILNLPAERILCHESERLLFVGRKKTVYCVKETVLKIDPAASYLSPNVTIPSYSKPVTIYYYLIMILLYGTLGFIFLAVLLAIISTGSKSEIVQTKFNE